MGYQIVMQTQYGLENDPQLYAIWSSYTDSIIFWDATEEEIHEFFRDEALSRFEESHARLMEDVKTKVRPYHQFTLTWEQAVKEHALRHGPLDGSEDGSV